MLNFWSSIINKDTVRPTTLYLIVSNIGWLSLDRIARVALGVFVWITVARYLGPNEFGLLNYCLALVSIFGTVATLGLNRIAIRELVNHPSDRGEILGTITLIRFMAACVILVCLIYVSIQLSAGDSRTPILVFIVGLSLIFQSLDSIDFWFQSQVQSKFTVIAKSISFLVCAVIKLYLVSINAPLIAFAIVIAAEALLASIGLTMIYFKQDTFTLWRFKLNNSLSLLKESWPEAIAGISTLVFMRMDQVMLGEMLNTEAVGQYAAASRISEILYFIPIIIVSSTFPMVVSSKQKENEYHTHLTRLFSILAIISYLVALFFTLLAGDIVLLLYGEAFSDAANVLVIHAWTLLIVSFGLISGSWIISEKRIMLSMSRTLIGAVSNIVLNLMLIPRYGLVGAAVGTLFSQIIAYYFFDFFAPSMKSICRMKTRAFLVLDLQTLFIKPSKKVSI